MPPRDYAYQGQRSAELVNWTCTQPVGEWLMWIVAGTLHGVIPYEG